MLKLIWGVMWRTLMIWFVLANVLALIFTFIVPAESWIKLKPSISYLIMALIFYFLTETKRLNRFVWSRVAEEIFGELISKLLILFFIISSLINVLIAFFTSTGVWVDSLIPLRFFMFFIVPLIISFVVKYKESKANNIEVKQ